MWLISHMAALKISATNYSKLVLTLKSSRLHVVTKQCWLGLCCCKLSVKLNRTDRPYCSHLLNHLQLHVCFFFLLAFNFKVTLPFSFMSTLLQTSCFNKTGIIGGQNRSQFLPVFGFLQYDDVYLQSLKTKSVWCLIEPMRGRAGHCPESHSKQEQSGRADEVTHTEATFYS